MRLIIEVKNPTEELTGHILFTLVVGYFACAQYDALFFYLSLRGSEATKQTPGRVKVYGAYFPFFFRGIAAALRASQ